MPEVTADGTTLMRQAPMTAEYYLRGAVEQIDSVFGDGFAKKNPQLVGVFMQVSAQDLHTAMLKCGAQDIAAALEQIASAVESAE